MNFKKCLKTAFFCLSFSVHVHGDTRIILYLQHPPAKIIDETIAQAQQEKILDSLGRSDQKSPSKLSKKLVKGSIRQRIVPKLSGFPALYAGYVDYSNTDGLISFPLRHVTPKIYLAITSEIKPVKVKGETLSHYEFVAPDVAETALYTFERKESEDKQTYWTVSQALLPKDNKISPLTIVLLTKPKNIVVPEGDFLATDVIQFVLPALYVVGNVDSASTLMKFMNLSNVFEPTVVEQKKASDLAVQQLIINI
jgi:hypothetical protein